MNARFKLKASSTTIFATSFMTSSANVAIGSYVKYYEKRVVPNGLCRLITYSHKNKIKIDKLLPWKNISWVFKYTRTFVTNIHFHGFSVFQ